jgi:hypothetical protein
MLTSQQVAAKWAANTSAASTSFKNGVQAVSVSPTAKAAQSLDRYQAGVLAAVSSGRMAAALNAVSLDDWKNSMLTKAAARIPQGVQAAVGKVTAFMDKWLPYQAQLQARIAAMPKGGVAEAQARASAAIAYNAAFSKRLPGS